MEIVGFQSLDEMLAELTPEQRTCVEDRFNRLRRRIDRCPMVILPVGVPGSGKSTWVDRFIEMSSHPTVKVSTDDQIEHIAAAIGKSYNETHRETDMRVLESKMRDAIKSAAIRKDNIIVDRTNVQTRARDRCLSVMPNYYVRVAVVFELEKQELFARLKRRQQQTGKYIPAGLVEQMLADYQPPTYNEFDIIIHAIRNH